MRSKLLIHALQRFLHLGLLLFVAAAVLSPAFAEKVADLPVPTSYVNDFAGVLSPDTRAQLESLARTVHNQAAADLFVVTVHSLDDGESIEQFSADLVEKWKIGKKGEDRSALFLISENPRRMRIEVGYGLEGILNDAKTGRILDDAVPFARSGDYNSTASTVLRELSQVVAADRGVTLPSTANIHQYHRETVTSGGSGVGQLVLAVFGVILFLILWRTGNLGWAFYLLLNLLGSGGGRGGGGGGGGDDEGGGFGGVGGGGSGGGGASRDF